MGEQTSGITEDLVAQKIAFYCNVGRTVAPEPILSLLKARSGSSTGEFLTPEQEAGPEQEEEPPCEEAPPVEEPEAEPEEAEAEAAEDDMPWQNGMVTGLVGTRMGINGVLDLRGVSAEQVATIEELRVNGLVLMDEGSRGALAGAKTQINGTIVVAPPGMRVMVQPEIELSKASLEAMPAGQKLMIVGNMFFRPDIPPALVAEKFEDLRLVGVIVMSEGVQGALLGRGDTTGVSVVYPASVTSVVRSVGNNTWTADYLARLPDGIAYINIGNTFVPA
jgi:hypothetical protein